MLIGAGDLPRSGKMEYVPRSSAQNAAVCVAVRIRPTLGKEKGSKDLLDGDSPDPSRIVLLKKPNYVPAPGESAANATHSFVFDHVLHPDSTQDMAYRVLCKPLVEHYIQGFNCCLFAYGATGSGKTHTIFGPDGGEIYGTNRGVVPRVVSEVFEIAERRRPYKDIRFYVSFLEIYMDHVGDLAKGYRQDPLSPGRGRSSSPTRKGVLGRTSSSSLEVGGSKQGLRRPASATAQMLKKLVDQSNSTSSIKKDEVGELTRRSSSVMTGFVEDLREKVRQEEVLDVQKWLTETHNLEIREKPDGSVYVKDLSTFPVNSVDDVMRIIHYGVKRRATNETRVNEYSSRSHTIFSLRMMETERDAVYRETKTSVFNVVDLAGSERLKKSESTHLRMKEAININKSLTALGTVILSIDQREKHTSYRASKLTRILQDSLGGNSFTTLIGTLNTAEPDYEECLATLQFAQRCKNVQNQPVVNYLDVDVRAQERRIKKLQMEIMDLRDELTAAQDLHRETLDRLHDLQKRGDTVAMGELIDHQQSLFKRAREESHKLKSLLQANQESYRDMTEKMKRDAAQSHEKYTMMLSRMKSDLEQEKCKGEQMLTEQLSMHDSEVRRMLQRSQDLLNGQLEFLASLPDWMKQRGEMRNELERESKEEREKLEREFRASLQELGADSDERVQLVRENFIQLLSKRDAQVKRMEKTLQEVRVEYKKSVATLKKRILTLSKFASASTKVFEAIDDGKYPMHVRNGIKYIDLGESGRSVESSEKLQQRVSLSLDRAEIFLKNCTNEQFVSGIEALTDTLVESSESSDEEAMTPRTPRVDMRASMTCSPRVSTPRRPMSARASGRESGPMASNSLVRPQSTVPKLTAPHLFGRSMSAVSMISSARGSATPRPMSARSSFSELPELPEIDEGTLMDGIVDDSIHEYIEQLRGAAQKYHSMYQGEVKKHNDLRVAFESRGRELDRVKAGTASGASTPRRKEAVRVVGLPKQLSSRL